MKFNSDDDLAFNKAIKILNATIVVSVFSWK